MKGNTMIEESILTIPQQCSKRNAAWRQAARRAEKLLEQKKGNGQVEVETLTQDQKQRVSLLWRGKQACATSFSMSETNTIRRWRNGNVLHGDLDLIVKVYERHLGAVRMGDKL